jgi:hypothetical protein
MRNATFISDPLRLGDTTISPRYEGFHGYVPPNFRTVDLGSKWQRQWRPCSCNILPLGYLIVLADFSFIKI